jgi:hypothetical protein
MSKYINYIILYLAIFYLLYEHVIVKGKISASGTEVQKIAVDNNKHNETTILPGIGEIKIYGDGCHHLISSDQCGIFNSVGVDAKTGDEYDWAAIQYMINNVSQHDITIGNASSAYRNGGIVKLKRGIYIINRPIQLYYSVTLAGEGRVSFRADFTGKYPTGTVINYLGDSGLAAINITGFRVETGVPIQFNDNISGKDLDSGSITACENARLMDLTIYSGKGDGQCGVNLCGAPTSSICDVASIGFKTGIRVRSSWGGECNNIFIKSSDVALSIENDTNGWSFSNMYLNSNPNHENSQGLNAIYARACCFDRLILEHASIGAILNKCQSCSFTSLYIEDISKNCIMATRSGSICINGMYINCPKSNFMSLQFGSNIVVNGVSVDSINNYETICDSSSYISTLSNSLNSNYLVNGLLNKIGEYSSIRGVHDRKESLDPNTVTVKDVLARIGAIQEDLVKHGILQQQ